MTSEKPGILQQLFSFFNWEVTCECCGSRYNGNLNNQNTNAPEEVKMVAPKKEQNPRESHNNLLQDLTIEKGADKLFEQMISPSAQKPAINTPIRKHKNVVKGSSSRWNKDKETHLQLYLNQYGNDLDLVQGFFPGFSREFLQKKLEKINNNLIQKFTPADESKLKQILETTGYNLDAISRQFPNRSESEIKELCQKFGNKNSRDSQNFSASNLPENYEEYTNEIYGRQIDIEHDHFNIDSNHTFPHGYIYDLHASKDPSETESYQDFNFGANDDDAFNFDYEKMNGGNLFTPDEKGKNQYALEEVGYLMNSDPSKILRSNYFDGVDYEISEAFNGGEMSTTADERKNFELEKEMGVKVNAFLNLEGSKVSAEAGDQHLFEESKVTSRRSKFYETST